MLSRAKMFSVWWPVVLVKIIVFEVAVVDSPRLEVVKQQI